MAAHGGSSCLDLLRDHRRCDWRGHVSHVEGVDVQSCTGQVFEKNVIFRGCRRQPVALHGILPI